MKLSPVKFHCLSLVSPFHSRLSGFKPSQDYIHLQRRLPRGWEVRVEKSQCLPYRRPGGKHLFLSSHPWKLWATQTLSLSIALTIVAVALNCGGKWQLWLHWRKPNSWQGLVGVLLICTQIDSFVVHNRFWPAVTAARQKKKKEKKKKKKALPLKM